MNLTHTHRRPLLVSAIVIVPLLVATVLGAVRGRSTVDVTVKNDSQRSMQHLYFASGDTGKWSGDQLNGTVIPSGGSFVLRNLDCNGANVRIIAEDQNGCFVYDNVSCDADQTWDITDASTPDCGG